jgi:PadR family transcriptional regulator, regulatory protein PadR
MHAEDKNLEEAKAQMRKGLLEYCILLIIARGEIYASDILNELRDADLLVVEGTLYPLLSRLKTGKLLEYNWQESSSGPPRKYYSLTESGRETLEELNHAWQGLDKSITKLIKRQEQELKS